MLDKSTIKANLHREVYSEVRKASEEFYRKHGYYDPKLLEKLNLEAIRVRAMVDESILNERFKRGKTTAIIAGGLGLLVSFLTGGLFILPLIAAGIAYFASIYTIKTTYIARVRGAMSSVLAVHENELATKKAKTIAQPEETRALALDGIKIPTDDINPQYHLSSSSTHKVQPYNRLTAAAA